MKPAIAMLAAGLMVDAATWFASNQFEAWGAALDPIVVFGLMGAAGGTLIGWLSKSPFDAVRHQSRRRSDTPASTAHERRRSGLGV